jgi:sec-independent protein translocase protein TatC
MSSEMTFVEHLDELRSRVVKTIIPIIVIAIISLTFGMKPMYSEQYNLTIFYPVYSPYDNLAVQLTHYMQDYLLPDEVSLIQTAPGQAFYTMIYVSFLIGLIGAMPIILIQIYGFVAPAFSTKIKLIGLSNVLFPTAVLFVSGILFSYFVVIPVTLIFLYNYGEAMGTASFFSINEFIPFVLQFFISFGITFQLPVIMYVIALGDLADSRFWTHNLRYTLIILVVFGAIVTPDGSGITMWLFAGPMIGLYLIGILVIRRREKRIQLNRVR